jgi:hypothetical protein
MHVCTHMRLLASGAQSAVAQQHSFTASLLLLYFCFTAALLRMYQRMSLPASGAQSAVAEKGAYF